MQLLDIDPQDQAEEDGGHMDLDAQRKGKCAVIKTSTRQVCKLELGGATRDSFPVIVRYMYHSLVKEHPPPYFGPNFPYRVKVYLNERLPWSKVRVANGCTRGV